LVGEFGTGARRVVTERRPGYGRALRTGFHAAKTVTRRLSERGAGLYAEWIENDRRLRAVVEQMRRVAEEARALILAAGEEPTSSP
jgi:hypothetical protein